MQPGISLQLKTSPSLVMTQQLQQSIKLLQMSTLELQAFVEDALEQNPFLETTEPDPETSSAEETKEREEREENEIESPDGESTKELEDISWDGAGTLGGVYETRFAMRRVGEDGEEWTVDDAAAPEMTLQEHLLQQLQVQVLDPVHRAIGMALIDLIDEAGYIKEPLKSVAEQLGTKESMVEEVLRIVQHFDPPGIAARDLRECLSLQLKDLDRLDPAMVALLNNLDLLAHGDMAKLQAKCGVSVEDLKDMIVEIRALNPKPGAKFDHEINQAVEPDVFIRPQASGWHIELNTRTLPKVLVDKRYHASVTVKARDQVEKKFISEQMAHAHWLLKTIDQRAQTIMKVTAEIVAQQDSFFRLGIHHLKPLTMREVAAATGYHESTISRATTHKYVATPRGMYELKYFFTSSLGHSAGGDDVSSETVKHLIRELVGKETAAKILSDEDIAALLKTRNIAVARRTVAKYREAIHIPPSSQRRRKIAIG